MTSLRGDPTESARQPSRTTHRDPAYGLSRQEFFHRRMSRLPVAAVVV